MMWNYGWHTGGWVLMSLMMIVFWTLVIGAVVYLGRRGNHRQPTPAPTNQIAHQILDERFARGELTETEYRQRRDLLNTR